MPHFPQMDICLGRNLITKYRATDFVCWDQRHSLRSWGRVAEMGGKGVKSPCLCLCMHICDSVVCARAWPASSSSASVTPQATGEALRKISLCGSCPLLCLIKSGHNPICVSLFNRSWSEAVPFIYWIGVQGWWSVYSEVTALILGVCGVFKDHRCSSISGLHQHTLSLLSPSLQTVEL